LGRLWQLLHDGEPRGTRRNRGQEVSVFDEIARPSESGMRTWQGQVSGRSIADIEVAQCFGTWGAARPGVSVLAFDLLW
jgi:hypothetical protein